MAGTLGWIHHISTVQSIQSFYFDLLLFDIGVILSIEVDFDEDMQYIEMFRTVVPM